MGVCAGATDRSAGHLRQAGRWGALLALLALAGCGTLNSYASGCPAPFSGVRTDNEYLGDLGSFSEDGFDWVTTLGDMPLSAVLDLVTLPIGIVAEHPPPEPVSPGCRWAIRER
jgi:uncharacterized protein YceK